MMQLDYPLIVDLDGTLVRTDMLVESALLFVRDNPARVLEPVSWFLISKANLKAKLAAAAPIDVTALPYDNLVISFLTQEKEKGRTLILATATHKLYADAVAAHLGLFDRVLSSDVANNLSAKTKRDVLVREFGEKGFDYVGNSSDDLTVWKSARKAYLSNPEFGVETAAKGLGNLESVISPPDHYWRDWTKELRLHQWAKNALLFVPLLAAHRVNQFDLLLTGFLAFLLFSICASSVYLLNDLLDLEDDRQHPRKRYRPLAAGAVSIKAALLIVPGLLFAAFAGAAWLLPWKFTLVLACYYALTLAYSLVLKRIMTIDVIALAVLYTVRIVAGAVAFDISLTFWMLAFSMFLFLSLALLKRYSELGGSRRAGRTDITPGRGYSPYDLEMIASLGAASGYLSVLIFALYIQDQHTMAQYQHPQVIWLACPLLLYWITRTWMLAHRGCLHDDPVVFALKDLNSLLTGALFAAVFLFAT